MIHKSSFHLKLRGKCQKEKRTESECMGLFVWTWRHSTDRQTDKKQSGAQKEKRKAEHSPGVPHISVHELGTLLHSQETDMRHQLKMRLSYGKWGVEQGMVGDWLHPTHDPHVSLNSVQYGIFWYHKLEWKMYMHAENNKWVMNNKWILISALLFTVVNSNKPLSSGFAQWAKQEEKEALYKDIVSLKQPTPGRKIYILP